jgi:Zn-dependent protease
MLKTKIAGVTLGADFTFFAVAAMFTFLDTGGFALMSLAACLIHELGHLTAMLLRRKKPSAVTLRGGGIAIENGCAPYSPFILAAGSTANFVVFAVLFLVLPRPYSDLYPIMFALSNLWIGLFNLLPVGCLDGNRLLALVLPARILRVIEVIAVLATVIAAAMMFLREGGVNLTIVAVVIYVIAVDFFGKVWYT